jgi:hypothetical protein
MLAVGSLAAGCGGTPAGGDPGDRRLHELSGDQVFAVLPDGATSVDLTKKPAHYRKPSFGGGGWDGPSVVVTFKSAAAPEDVYRFLAQRAAAAGWHSTATGALGLADRWAKTYPDGAAATLVLTLLTRSQAATERVYRLSGGVAPVVD